MSNFPMEAVKEELAGIETKLLNLTAFLSSEESKKLSEVALALLVKQGGAMHLYATSLKERIIAEEHPEAAVMPDTSDTNVLSNVNDLFTAVSTWHSNAMSDIKNLSLIPQGTEVSITSREPGSLPVQLELSGKLHDAFLVGVSAAETIVSTFPFVAMEDNNVG